MAAISLLNPKAEFARAAEALAVNISAAKGIQDVMKTNLGPKGTMKMYVFDDTHTCSFHSFIYRSICTNFRCLGLGTVLKTKSMIHSWFPVARIPMHEAVS